MPRQRYTLAQLKDRLRERAGNNERFWTDPELRDALNEAISVYQALTGEWTTQKSIPAVSSSPSFYPVPKEIVSLTRVGTDSDVSTANPLGGTIIVEKPAFESDVTLNFYHTAWDVNVPMRFIPIGGVGPYTISWDFGDGDTASSGLELIYHTWDLPAGVDPFLPTPITITATVRDVTGDVFVCTFPLTLIDPHPTIWAGPEPPATEYTGIPFTFGVASADGTWIVMEGHPISIIEYDGSSATNFAGNRYAGRYPITVEFDFQPSPGVNVSEPSGRAQVEKVELWESTGSVLLQTKTLVGGGELKFSHYMTDFSKWNNGVPRTLRGFLNGSTMRQDPDNVQVDIGPPFIGDPGIVRLWMRRNWFDTEGVANFNVTVTDGTGKSVKTWAEYTAPPPPPDTIVFGTISSGCPGDTGLVWPVHIELNSDPLVFMDTTVTSFAGDATYSFTLDPLIWPEELVTVSTFGANCCSGVGCGGANSGTVIHGAPVEVDYFISGI